MNLTALQKAAAQAIVNIFETGSVRGNYSDVTLLRGDSGQLTYGRSQTTLASGNLYLLIADYAARADGAYAQAMKPYLEALEDRDSRLNYDTAFRGLLKDAGDDPVMHEVQDAFFDRVYWDPAMRSAVAIGAQSPLGAAIVYDSTVHGSWAHVRDLTRKAHGELKDVGEKAWMRSYVDTRRTWLATHSNALLHKTVYRMDAFKTILDKDNWPLTLALIVRGLTINENALAGSEPVKVTAEGTPRRLLKLKTPPLEGADVSWLQERLARAGIDIEETGIFEAKTDAAVKSFQQNHDLKPDGVVGPVTRTALEDLSVTVPVIEVPEQPMPAVNPVVLEPYPAVPPAPRTTVTEIAPQPQTETHGTAPPPHRPPASHPAPAPQPVPQPAQSDETKTAIEDLKKNLDAHQAKVLQSLLAGDVKGALSQIDQGRSFVQRILANGRAYLAAALSLLTLIFTEGRDLLAWSQGGTPPTEIAKGQGPSKDVFQFMGSARDWVTEAYVSLHNIAAQIPNEWVFRLRVAALALIAYAVTRFARRRKAAK